MNRMFQGATSFDQDINKKGVTVEGLNYTAWNTAAVIDMNYMIRVATSFDQNLIGWCVTNITTEPTSFATGSSLRNLNRPVWGTCPQYRHHLE